MTRAFACLLLAVVSGCRQEGAGRTDTAADSAGLIAREERITRALASTDSTDRGKPLARWIMPAELAEISGLTLTSDGRLFAHNDEAARVVELDYKRGTIVKQFYIGKQGLRGDFEAIAWVRDRFYLLSSEGTLYEFREGADGERVDYDTHDTKLGKECEFEGLAFDSTANALVLACKNVGVKKLKDFLVLYKYTLGDSGGPRVSEVSVPMAQAIGQNRWKEVRPTDITVDPRTGNYVLVAAQEKAILSITPAGSVVFSRPIGGRHPQTEGIAITADGVLILSDEALAQPATITLYRWP